MKAKNNLLIYISFLLCVSCSSLSSQSLSSGNELPTSSSCQVSEVENSLVEPPEGSYSKEYFYMQLGDNPTNYGTKISFYVEDYDSGNYTFFMHKGTLKDYSSSTKFQSINNEAIYPSDFGLTLDYDTIGYYVMGIEKHSDSIVSELVIPESFNNLPVLGIAYPAKADMTDYDLQSSCDDFSEIKRIVLPSSLQYLCDGAFFHFCNLEEVEYNSSLTFLPSDCFYGLTNLKQNSIPDAITSIYGAFKFSGINDFAGNNNLNNITRAFMDCSELKKVDLSNSNISDCDYAFCYCSELETVLLPSSLKEIGFSMFASCKQIKEINIPEGCEEIGGSAFAECTSLSKLTLPHSIQSIEADAFRLSTNLTEITYEGTMEEWNKITIKYQEQYDGGFGYSSIEKICCSDGDIQILSQTKSENSN